MPHTQPTSPAAWPAPQTNRLAGAPTDPVTARSHGGLGFRPAPGDAATPGEKRLLLAGLLMMSANIAQVPKAFLDSLMGLVVHPLMHRRSLCPCFHRIFKLMNDHKAEKILTLPAGVREELCYAALLMPVARTNLRAQVDTLITATDATPSSGGSVACAVSRRLAEALFRSVYYRGGHRRLRRRTWELRHLNSG